MRFSKIINFKEKLKGTKLGILELEIEGKRVKIDLFQEIIKKNIQNGRESNVDYRARDEIISYYRDGSTVDKIYQVLSESSLYDYVNEKDILKIRKKILEGILQMNDYLDFEITKEKIKSLIDYVFEEKYKEDLKRWISAIKILEEKGYKREEIINLLYQKSVSDWHNLARRMPQ